MSLVTLLHETPNSLLLPEVDGVKDLGNGICVCACLCVHVVCVCVCVPSMGWGVWVPYVCMWYVQAGL